MRIDRIVLRDFRNLRHVEIGPFSQGLNLFYGRNGSGKSNILEAIGLSSLAKSCRGAPDGDMVNFGAATAAAEIYGQSQKKKSTSNYP